MEQGIYFVNARPPRKRSLRSPLHVPYPHDRQPWAQFLDKVSPLAAARVACRPTRPPIVECSRLIAGALYDLWPDEGGLKTHGLCLVGSEGVCGWLANGYYYPKTIGGQPKLISVGISLAASLHGEGPHVIGGWYPPSEGRMG